MNSQTFKTKTFWTGLAAVLTGVGLIMAKDIPNGIMTILGGLGMITGRDALTKLQIGK